MEVRIIRLVDPPITQCFVRRHSTIRMESYQIKHSRMSIVCYISLYSNDYTTILDLCTNTSDNSEIKYRRSLLENVPRIVWKDMFML